MDHFDVIIVGAGPAGLNAAKILGDAKKKVLLLERNEKIGPKICAGGLSRKAVHYLNLPREIIDYSYDKLYFIAPHIKTVVNLGEDFFYTVSREKLGQWQLEKINRNFVEIRTSTRVSKIEKDKIELENGEKFEFNYLIGADGANSVVRKYLGLEKKYIGIAIQYILPKEKFNKFEIHLNSKLFSAWYAWIFPHKQYVSIGYGHPILKFNAKRQAKNFEKWALRNKIDLSKGRKEGFPINGDYQGYKFGNIFLTGDAAGLASGFTGEGIYQALVSGEEVANVIIDKNYKPHWVKEILKERFFHHLFLRIIYYSGPLRNLIFDLVAIGVKNKFLGKTLMRILS